MSKPKPRGVRIPWYQSLWIYAAGMFLLTAGLYLLTLPRTNVGFGLSDEVMSVAYHHGLVRPPGYPLYTAILYIILHLPIPDVSLAMKGHFLSLVFVSLASALVFSAVWKLYKQLNKVRPHRYVLFSPLAEQVFFAFLPTAAVFYSGLVWLYGITAGPVAVTIFYTALLLYLFSSFLPKLTSKNYSLAGIFVFCFSLGLAVSHQPLFILLVPILFLLIWEYRAKLSLKIYFIWVIGIVLGMILPLGFIYIFAKPSPFLSWPLTFSLNGLINYYRNSDVLGFINRFDYFTEKYTFVSDINQIIASSKLWFWEIWSASIIWLIPSLVLGIYLALKSFRQLLKYLLLYSFFGFISVVIYRSSNDWLVRIPLMRLYASALISFTPLIALALFLIIKRLGSALTIFFRPTIASIFLVLILTLPLAVQLYRLFPAVDLSHFSMIHDRNLELLQTVKPNALITCYSDSACFSLLFDQYTSRLRSDVDIYPLAFPYVLNGTLNKPGIKGFTYDLNPYILFDVITWNLSKRPVYALELSDQYYRLLGFDYPYMFYVPMGYYGELVRTLPKFIPTYDSKLTQNWLSIPTVLWDANRLQAKSTPAREHLINGMLYTKMNLKDRSLAENNLAAAIFYQFTQSEKTEFNAIRTNLEQAQANQLFIPGSTVSSISNLLKRIPLLLSVKQNRQAYQAALAALAIEPQNVMAHLYLADIYEKMGDSYFARKEYTHVLMLDPHNASAAGRLNILPDISTNPNNETPAF
jgi:hypothetical protein